MLEKVRNQMQSGYTYVLIAFLIVIFMFFFGMPTRGCGRSAGPGQIELATYDGETVQNTDVSLIYNRFFGDDQGRDDDKFARQQARSLRSYLLIELFADRARNAGLRVGDDEFRQYMTDTMRNIEYRYFYGREGKWNGKYYQAYVGNQLRSQLEDYETFKREELLARKYLALHDLSVLPFPQELSDTHAFKKTKIDLSYVALDPEKLRGEVALDEAAIESFRKDNPDRIESYYESNEDQFSSPAEVRIRRVYIPKSGGEEGSEKAAEKTKSRWTKAKKRVLEEGEPIGEVAADLGESYPGQKRGLMDWSTRDNLNQNIADAVETAEIGTVEEVVTDHAYMLVKVEDRREATTTPLEEAGPEIARELLAEERAASFVDSAADELLDAATENDSLEAALESVGDEEQPLWETLSVSTTGDFTLETTNMGGRLGGRLSGMNLGSSWAKIPGIGKSKELSTLAYRGLSSENPVPDQTFEIEGATHIVRLKSKSEPEGEPELDMRVKQGAEKTADVFGSWTGIFQMPAKEYGPWIKAQFQSAVESGKIQLNTEKSKSAQLLANGFEPVGGGSKAGKKLKLSPGSGKKKDKKGKGQKLKLSPGGDDGDGKGQKLKLSPGGDDGDGDGQKLKLSPGGDDGDGEGPNLKLSPGEGENDKGKKLELSPGGEAEGGDSEGSGGE